MPPQPPTIRRATGDDLDALARLAAASRLLQRYGATFPALRESMARGLERADPFLVAELPAGAAAEIVGLAWLILTPAFTRAAYLRLLLVSERHQAGGVGAALLARAESEARLRANHLFLLTTADNAGARRFYERHGYRLAGSLPGFTAPGLDELLYHKPLRGYAERLPG